MDFWNFHGLPIFLKIDARSKHKLSYAEVVICIIADNYRCLAVKICYIPLNTLSNLTVSEAHRESCPLLGHVWYTEGSSFVAVRRFLFVSVVEQDALEATSYWSEGQAQFYNLLRGICDGKEHSSSLRGRADLHKKQKPVRLKVLAWCTMKNCVSENH